MCWWNSSYCIFLTLKKLCYSPLSLLMNFRYRMQQTFYKGSLKFKKWCYELMSIYSRGGQPFEARVPQKEKSKLREYIYYYKKHNLQYEINQCETWCCFCALRDEMSGATDETGHANLLIAITWALTHPHNFNWHRAMVEGKVLSNTIERAARLV